MPKQPEDVFTPRLATVNAEMYVRRPGLEARLTDAVKGSLNLVLHGQSGCGKSWLYKQVLDDDGVFFLSANLANAARLGTITAEIDNVVSRQEEPSLASYSEAKKAEGNIGVAKAKLEHTNQYELGKKEPFERCLQLARKKAGDRLAVGQTPRPPATATAQQLAQRADTSEAEPAPIFPKPG